MNIVKVKSVSERVKRVKKLMGSVENQIGSVWFLKRSDGKLRKMAYRIHVSHPTYEKEPTGKNRLYKKAEDAEKNLITIFDVNTIRYNNKHRICGRGGFKSVPLDGVVRVKVGGEIYRFVEGG